MKNNRHLYIDGQWRKGEGSLLQSLNPATDEVIWEGHSATKEDVKRAVEAAAKAFEDWGVSHLETRINSIKRFQGLLENQSDALAKLISQETGKPLWESRGEVASCNAKVDVSLRAFRERCHMVESSTPQGFSVTRFKPHGVVAVFGPFNFPAHLPNGHIVPALLAGNTIVFKPSEWTPAVAAFLTALWEEAGLPPGVLNLVQGDTQTGQSLAQHPRIDGLFFTGSARTGCALAEYFGKHPEKILALEMGGNNPLVVDKGCDPKIAAYLTVQSAFITTGQRCTCARRLILCESPQSESFLNALVTLAESLEIGPYNSPQEVFCGPLIHKQAASNALQAQATLIEKGAHSLMEMRPLSHGQAFVSPGILDVTAISERPDEEVFGPLLQVIRVPDLDAAIKEANHTRYGLSAGLISTQRAHYQTFYRKCRAGIINWNTPLTGASSSAPFGGTGISGNHRPSAFFACDYCSYPVASIENPHPGLPQKLAPGIKKEAIVKS